jgi:hypothetical protein
MEAGLANSLKYSYVSRPKRFEIKDCFIVINSFFCKDMKKKYIKQTIKIKNFKFLASKAL